MAIKRTGKKAAKAKRTASKKAGKHAPSKRAATKPVAGKKAVRAKTTVRKKRARRTHEQRTAGFAQGALKSRSGLQSGDLEGLRDSEIADSESVDELLEEGNAFEAGVVAGVEKAEDDEESEVRTHEVPEDDVPEEYKDRD